MVMAMDSLGTAEYLEGEKKKKFKWPRYETPDGIILELRTDKNPHGFYEAYIVPKGSEEASDRQKEPFRGKMYTSKFDFEREFFPWRDLELQKLEIKRRRKNVKKYRERMSKKDAS